MKKILAIMLVALSLLACNGNDTTDPVIIDTSSSSEVLDSSSSDGEDTPTDVPEAE